MLPSNASDDASVEIGNLLSHDPMRFKRLLDAVQKRLPLVSEDEVAMRLLEMEWLGVVQIDGSSHPHNHWQVRRRVG